MSNNDQIIITQQNYDANSYLGKLITRGVNPLRPEIISIIEFLPLTNKESNGEYSPTNAAKFAEIQRLLKEFDYNSICSLIEKESGITISLMNDITQFARRLFQIYSAAPNKEESMALIFSDSDFDNNSFYRYALNFSRLSFSYELAFLDNFGVPGPALQEINLFNNKLIKDDIIESNTIQFAFNFPDDLESYTIGKFLSDNYENPKILLLIRSVLAEACSAQIIRKHKKNVSNNNDLDNALFLGKITYPELSLQNNSSFQYANIINNFSDSRINESPLLSCGITLEDSAVSIDEYSDRETSSLNNQEQHNMSFSNSHIFLNVIGLLTGELFFYGTSGYDNPSRLISDADQANGIKKIKVGRLSQLELTQQTLTVSEIIKRLKSSNFADFFSMGNRYDGKTPSVDNNIAKNLYDNIIDTMCFCMYNQVVGDNVFLLEKNILKSGYRDSINFSAGSSKSKLLAEYIHRILLRLSYYNSDRPDWVNTINLDLTGIKDFDNVEENNLIGEYSKFPLSYRNEQVITSISQNIVYTENSNNKFIFLETSKGIYDFEIESGNLIPTVDALINNKANSNLFDASFSNQIFNQATAISEIYNLHTKSLIKDIISLFGLGYDIESGKSVDITAGSLIETVTNKGITPINYLNYYMTTFADTLYELGTNYNNQKNNLGERGGKFSDKDSIVHNVRGALLSIALILNSDENDYLDLFKGFYFDPNANLASGMKLPLSDLDEDAASKMEKQFTLESHSSVDKLFQKLLSTLGVDITSSDAHLKDINFIDNNTKYKSVLKNNQYSDNLHIGGYFGSDVSSAQYYLLGQGPPIQESWNISANQNMPVIMYNDNLGTGHKKIASLAFSKNQDSDDNNRAGISFGNTNFNKKILSKTPLYEKLKGQGSLVNNNIETGNKTASEYINNRFDGSKAYKYDPNDLTKIIENNSSNTLVTGGIADINHVHQCYMIFIWYVKLLKKCLSVKMSAFTQKALFDDKFLLSMIINRDQLFAIADALYGKPKNNSTNGAYYNDVYDIAKEYIDETINSINLKRKNILTKLNLLSKNSLDIQTAVQNIIDDISQNSSVSNNFEKFSYKLYDHNNFILSKDLIGNNINYYYDHIANSRLSFPYSKYDKKDIKEYKTMYQVLSKTENFNLNENEKLGKKRILNIGIPAGLIDLLSRQAFAASNDDQYLDSSLIIIHIHRKNELNGEEEVYPRSFVFDTSKFISNINGKNNSDFFVIPSIEHLNCLMENNFTENNSIGSIVNKTTFLMTDRNMPDDQKISFINALNSNNYNEYMGTRGMRKVFIEGNIVDGTNYYNGSATTDYNGFRFTKDVCCNHLIDHYLKLYQNLMFDFETESYNFLLDSEKLFSGVPDTNDELVKKCRDNFKQFLLSYFPSYNVDQNTKILVGNALKNYDNLIFNSNLRKINQLSGGVVFDRVFSILLSEKSFVLSTDNYQNIYSSVPYLRIGPINSFSENEVFLNNNLNDVEKDYVKSITSPNHTSIYKFYATVSILRHW